MADNSYEQHGLENKELPIIMPVNASSGCGPNWHDDIELVYCASGKGLLICSGVEYTMEQGMLYVINSNEIHVMYDVQNLQYHYMIIAEQFLRQNTISTDAVEIETVLPDEKSIELFQEILGQMTAPEAYAIAKTRALLLLLMVRVLQCGAKKRENRETSLKGAERLAKTAVDYIAKNYRRKLTLDEIAQVVGFNKCYLARNFKKATGMTIVDYMNLTRCRSAKKLLQQKQLSVQQIASLCGYENASYFSKVFYRVMGLLPSQIEPKEENRP